jgi:2-polyprenyl-3-methyl-5-hydroxy-6-metoxy-1,4-benzoquinol methylase
MTQTTDHTFSCVVDGPAVLQLQAYYLVSSLLDVCGVDSRRIIVHAVGSLLPAFEAWLRQRAVRIVPVSPFGHPYCNKLQQLATFTCGSEGPVVLLDCDVFVVAAVQWPSPAHVAAKPVDMALPPARILRRVFEAAHLTARWTLSDLEGGPEGPVTVRNNCNGGVYVVSRDFTRELIAPWQRWARWCLANAALFEDHAAHVDQVSFALAMADLGVDAETLDRTLNFPTHLMHRPGDDCRPAVLHYHVHLDDQLLLRSTGLPGVDAAVATANDHILKWRRSTLANSLFFGARYELNPQIGSGVGSRGAILTYKREVLRQLLEGAPEGSVLEIGCGDLEVSRNLKLTSYIGVDCAPSAIALARQRRPDWKLEVGDPLDPSTTLPTADIVLCLDVLIHQTPREDYERLIVELAGLARRRLIVSGYDDAPAFTSSITHYYEPLTQTLERLADFDEITVVGGYRDVSVVVATRREGTPHPRDIAGSEVTVMSRLVDDPLRFRLLVDMARAKLGFFPAHNPRAIEYTWIVDRLAPSLVPGSVLDVGAGVNPLPFWLSNLGWRVTTVDDHSVVRSIGSRGSWNEWGYLDYGQIDARIDSRRAAFEDLAPASSYDALICVSVIEHLPASLRRRWLRLFGEHLRPGGRVLLTVDLVPWTEQLWCFREGAEVEAPALHGTFSDLVGELEGSGFSIASRRTWHHVPRSRVALGVIEAAWQQSEQLTDLGRV